MTNLFREGAFDVVVEVACKKEEINSTLAYLALAFLEAAVQNGVYVFVRSFFVARRVCVSRCCAMCIVLVRCADVTGLVYKRCVNERVFFRVLDCLYSCKLMEESRYGVRIFGRLAGAWRPWRVVVPPVHCRRAVLHGLPLMFVPPQRRRTSTCRARRKTAR
jgi:hypothetical protein